MPKLIIIVATSQNNVIGRNNKIPWCWTKDLQWFKKQTVGKAVVMGYNTWRSIDCKPLPDRENFVLTHKELENVVYKSSVEELMPYLQKFAEVFIIGGESIYKQYMNIVDEIQQCILPITVDGDKYFPEIPKTFKITQEIKENDERIIRYFSKI